MSRKGIVSIGNRREWPVEFWGPRDHEAERLEMEALRRPLPLAPGDPPPELKFSLFEPPILGGVRSRAIDELIAKHTGRRRRAR
jgi:hypothetical protein